MNFPSILTENSLTVVFADGPKVIHKGQADDKKWEKCIELLKAKEWEKLSEEMNLEKAITKFLSGQEEITISNGAIFYNDEIVDNYVANKILEFREEELDVEPLVNFLHRLMKNPSKHCIDKLYRFLEYKNMPVDVEGYFYAYKAVNPNFKDKYSGTIDNSVGQVVTMPRRKVNDHSEVGCSEGLHAGSIQYVESFASAGDKVVIVKIDPADVVTVPDEDVRKLRCCKYEVIQECEGLLKNTVFEQEESYDKGFWNEEGCVHCGESPEFCECEFCEDCGEVIEECMCPSCPDCCCRLQDCICETEEDAIEAKFAIGERVMVMRTEKDWVAYVSNLDKYIMEVGEVVGISPSGSVMLDFQDGESFYFFCKDWLHKVD